MLHVPLGRPRFDVSLDPKTGETITHALPVEITIGAGPVTSEQIKTRLAAIHLILPYGADSFTAVPIDYLFEDSGVRRMIVSSRTWKNDRTGTVGPMLFPSGADFHKMKFLIRNS